MGFEDGVFAKVQRVYPRGRTSHVSPDPGEHRIAEMSLSRGVDESRGEHGPEDS